MGQQYRDGWERGVARMLQGFLQHFCGAGIARVRAGKVLKLYAADTFRSLSHKEWRVGQREGSEFLQVPNLQVLHDVHFVLRSDDTLCAQGGVDPAQDMHQQQTSSGHGDDGDSCVEDGDENWNYRYGYFLCESHHCHSASGR